MPPTAPVTDREILVAFLYLLALSRRDRYTTNPNASAVTLTRSYIGEDFQTVANRLPVRALLGLKGSKTFGKTRFFQAVNALADLAEDDYPAVAARRVREGGTDVDCFRLSLDPAEWEDLLATITDPATGEEFGILVRVEEFADRAEALGLKPSEEIPQRAVISVREDVREDDEVEPDDYRADLLRSDRRCSTCQIVKPRADFATACHRCRACTSEYGKVRRAQPGYAAAHAEEQASYAARLQGRTREQIAEDTPDEKKCRGKGCAGRTLSRVWFTPDNSRRCALSYLCSPCSYARRMARK